MFTLTPMLNRLALVMILAISLAFITPVTADESGSDDIAVELVAENLDHPWSLAFLPNGQLLVTERSGHLRIINQGQVSEPVANVPAVYAKSQGGLMDVVLHPDYANNGWIYLTFAHGDAKANATRLVRAKLVDNALADVEILFTAQPYKDTPVHYGGRLAFLPDNSLLLSIGDGFDYREQAQRLDNHFGKLVRLHDNGKVPADNPFVDGMDTLPEIWSYGHRNPQAIVVDKQKNVVFAHEHGPAGGDEINVIVRGHNYGWPITTHGKDYSGAAISPYSELHGTDSPLLHWTPSIAPAGMALVAGDNYPEWQGNLMVAALKARELRRVSLNGESIQQQSLLSSLGERIRDVRQGPDGYLYVLTDSNNGRILKLVSNSQ